MSNRSCKRGHAALRRGRRSIPGQPYLVTFATHGRAPLFSDPMIGLAVAPAFVDPMTWRSSALFAWVLMPDHWHGLVQLGEGDELSATIRRLKANTGRVARQNLPEVERVWATGFHDRALRTDEALRSVARYLVMNPVRAGIVSRPGLYPFWDATWL